MEVNQQVWTAKTYKNLEVELLLEQEAKPLKVRKVEVKVNEVADQAHKHFHNPLIKETRNVTLPK